MQTVAPVKPKCAISQTMYSQRNKKWAPVQAQARLNRDLKKIIIILVFKDMFCCDKGIAMPRTKFGFFLGLKYSVWPFSGLVLALFGFFLRFSSGNPDAESLKMRSVSRAWSFLRTFPPLSWFLPSCRCSKPTHLTNYYIESSGA